ncbi:fibrillin [Candidatus Woesearchaeota archaeon]|nr:fibrillin [Candidatus Woesearchaeota archaeon]|tara:strand:- start:41 stop:703 length:663 start_codon:yes stop_codon:yes gene_type:complete
MSFPNVVIAKNRKKMFIGTFSSYPGTRHFEEIVKVVEGREVREWSPQRSKIAAAMAKGITQLGIKEGGVVLYLGASHGYTASFVSDMIGKEGAVFCLDHAPRVVRDLVFVCEKRSNMIPILGDAYLPDSYGLFVPVVDVVVQDIAQRDQGEIFLKNCARYLKHGGFGILSVKARSVDVSKRPQEVFKEVRALLEKEMIVADYRELGPFEKDHCLFVCKKR